MINVFVANSLQKKNLTGDPIFGAQIINLAREHQTGRAPKIGAFAPFDFTEGGIFSYTTFFIFCK